MDALDLTIERLEFAGVRFQQFNSTDHITLVREWRWNFFLSILQRRGELFFTERRLLRAELLIAIVIHPERWRLDGAGGRIREPWPAPAQAYERK